MFPISPDATAIKLIKECIERGVRLFEKEVLPQMKRGALTTRPQTGERIFYRKNQLPNNGMIDLNWNHTQMRRFYRALDLGPYPLKEFFT